MAGGKETPRQKMIGMMYLVLTALLALQIKDTVLEKFVLIDEGLKTSNSTYIQANTSRVGGIDTQFKNLGENENDQPVVDAAKKIRQETQEIIAYIDQIKEEISEISGGKKEDGTFARSTLKKYEEPTLILVKEKKADELEQRLNDYNSSVQTMANDVLKDRGGNIINDWGSLALAAKDIPLYQGNKELEKEDFAHFNFYKAPLASVLAQMTFFQNQILSRESDALNRLARALGAENFEGFDQISATILPVSRIVTAGTDFEAEMFLTASSSSLTPTMTLGNREISVDPNSGRGEIKFKANARENEYDANGLARKTFTGEVQFEQDGEPVTRTVDFEYFVARPTIEVRSEAIETLFLNCANNLNIDVPSLGPAYQPSFQATGGEAIKGQEKTALTVVPTSAEVKIDVSSSGNYIGQRTFKVEAPPRPAFEVFVDGRRYDAKKGISAAPRSFRLQLIPDENFKRKYPEDATYVVTKGRIELASGAISRGSVTINGPTLDKSVNQLRSLAKKGDRYVILIDEITRVNFRKETFPMPYTKNFTVVIN